MTNLQEQEKKLCECGAKLVFENVVMISYPPQYPYTCPKCGKRYVYRTDNTRWEYGRKSYKRK